MYPGQTFCARGILRCEGRQRHTNAVCAVHAAVSRRWATASRVHTGRRVAEQVWKLFLRFERNMLSSSTIKMERINLFKKNGENSFIVSLSTARFLPKLTHVYSDEDEMS